MLRRACNTSKTNITLNACVKGTIWQTFINKMLLHFTSYLHILHIKQILYLIENAIEKLKIHNITFIENTGIGIGTNLTEKVSPWDNEILCLKHEVLSGQMVIEQYGYCHFVQFLHHTVHLVVKGSCENHLNFKCNTLPNHMECCYEETCLLTSQSTIIEASISSHSLASFSGWNVLLFFRFLQ